MQVGTTKDQGLYNKPSAAVHPGTLAAGTLPQYNTSVPLGDSDIFGDFKNQNLYLKVEKQIHLHV